MPFENKTGLGGVSNYYGARDTGGSVGVEPSSDSEYRLSVALTGASLNGSFLPPVVIPRGARILRAFLRVDEAFVLGGTNPVVNIGGVAPATNGYTLTQAELQSVGTKAVASTGNGTWAAASATGTTAAEKVSQALGGTAPTVSATVGKATLIVEYMNKTKV
jgi:hypothetical protein